MAVAVTACPAFPAKVLIPGPRRALKLAARSVGARVVGSLHYSGVAQTPDSTLEEPEVVGSQIAAPHEQDDRGRL